MNQEDLLAELTQPDRFRSVSPVYLKVTTEREILWMRAISVHRPAETEAPWEPNALVIEGLECVARLPRRSAESSADPIIPPHPEAHGHVVPRPDGRKARCGGPALCPFCAREKAEQEALQGPSLSIEEITITRRSPEDRAAYFDEHFPALKARMVSNGIPAEEIDKLQEEMRAFPEALWAVDKAMDDPLPADQMFEYMNRRPVPEVMRGVDPGEQHTAVVPFPIKPVPFPHEQIQKAILDLSLEELVQEPMTEASERSWASDTPHILRKGTGDPIIISDPTPAPDEDPWFEDGSDHV